MDLKLALDKIDKLRIWGVKGALDYLVRICTPDRNRRFLIENARRYPMTPTRGITLLADMTQRTSLSKVMRDLAAKLKEADVPFQVFDTGGREDRLFKELNGAITPADEFRVLKNTTMSSECSHSYSCDSCRSNTHASFSGSSLPAFLNMTVAYAAPRRLLP